jgi:hypothetical protein
VGLLRNQDARHIDFEAFLGIIPSNPKLLPSDLDMVIERRGYFLCAEWKRPNERFSIGQRLMLEALSRKPDWRVLIVHGDTDDGLNVTGLWLLHGAETVHLGSTAEHLKEAIRFWYSWVEENAIRHEETPLR